MDEVVLEQSGLPEHRRSADSERQPRRQSEDDRRKFTWPIRGEQGGCGNRPTAIEPFRTRLSPSWATPTSPLQAAAGLLGILPTVIFFLIFPRTMIAVVSDMSGRVRPIATVTVWLLLETSIHTFLGGAGRVDGDQILLRALERD
jgi:hypothetical protein